MTFFDRFAERASGWVSSAPFFSFCVLMVLVWAPSILIIKSLDTWQLIINTTTTIITFLMVAILENSTKQFENAVHKKLDALLTGQADEMEWLARWNHEVRLTGDARKIVAHQLTKASENVREAVGCEQEIGVK